MTWRRVCSGVRSSSWRRERRRRRPERRARSRSCARAPWTCRTRRSSTTSRMISGREIQKLEEYLNGQVQSYPSGSRAQAVVQRPPPPGDSRHLQPQHVEAPSLRKQLISSSLDGSVTIWHFKASLRPTKFTGHKGAVYGVDVNPSGTLIASASKDGTARLWNNTV